MFLFKEERLRGQAKEQGLWRIGIEAYECRNEDTRKSDSTHSKTYLEVLGIADPVHSSVLRQNQHLDKT